MHDDEEMKAGSLVPEAHDGPHRGVELPGGDALAGHEEGVRHHVGVGSVQLAEHLPGVGVIISSVVTSAANRLIGEVVQLRLLPISIAILR